MCALSSLLNDSTIRSDEILKIDAKYHGRLIGRGGENIKELENLLKVKFGFPKRGSSDNPNEVVISGEKDNLVKAKTHILQLVEKYSIESVEILKIDAKYHGRLIGRGGENIQELKNLLEVKFRFPKPGSSDNPNEVVISGEKDNLVKAKTHIRQLVRIYSIESSEKLAINAKYHSLLIGKGGANINNLMYLLKVRISIPERGSNANPNEVIISGKKDNLDNAKTHILELIEEYKEERLKRRRQVQKRKARR